jgi:hypothetical protein
MNKPILTKSMRAVCVIANRVGDGAQEFKTDTGDTIYLCGIDRVKDVTLWDIGELTYNFIGNRGYYSFKKDQVKDSNQVKESKLNK